jgi:hypothetical protein
MAGGEVTIPDLASSGALGGTELLAGVQSGLTVKILVNQILAFIQNNVQINEAQVNNLVDDLADKQTLSDILTALSALTGLGLIEKTGAATFAVRSLANSDDISFALNGDGNYEATLNFTGVTPGTHGTTAGQTFSFQIDAAGRFLTITTLDIFIGQTQVQNLGADLAQINVDIAALDAAKCAKAANLSDLTDPAQAVINLGLGSAALLDASDFLQTANNLSDVPNDATARTNIGAAAAAILISAGGLLTGGGDLSSNRTITLDASAVLQPSNNLSELLSPSTARTNLGLGSIATQSAGSVTITGGTINGVAIGGSTPAAGTFTVLGFRNLANSFTSFFQNSATASRTYTLQDRNGTLADDTDLALKQNISISNSTKTANYTFVSADNGTEVIFNPASGTTLTATLPKQTTAALSTGFNVKPVNIGLGDVIIVREAGDILEAPSTLLGPNSSMFVILDSAGTPNTWRAYGGTMLFPIEFTKTLDGTVANGTYIISAAIPADVVLTGAAFGASGGSGTATLSLNGSNITNGALSVTTTYTTQGFTGNNTGSNGQVLQVVISAVSSLSNAYITVFGYRRF